eukprot:8798467-Alexandrium_andersonii.AAC.1
MLDASPAGLPQNPRRMCRTSSAGLPRSPTRTCARWSRSLGLNSASMPLGAASLRRRMSCG